ncbi:MAG: matrixin family metalloprotease [Deltaproteobacteria bacterium]|nr:matrixin family metalloprotease [Deltaproteobacteria bacterium]MCB9787230.1 matrixin family metalloprotease [Deltaproteobacteria bacterium]
MKFTLSTAALLCLATSPAFAYSVGVFGGVPIRWQSSTVSFLVQAAGSDDLTPAKTDIAINNAMATWNDLACSDLLLKRVGDAPNPKSNLLAGANPNGLNEVQWLEDSSWTFGKWVLGVTAPLTNSSGHISEADIAFNGYKQQWSINGDGRIDVESVAVHEIGHAFGLNHNLGPYDESDLPTMHPSVLPNLQSRTLSADDTKAACYLYPVAQYACAGDTDCPMILGRTSSGDEFYSGRVKCDAATKSCGAVEYFPAGIAQIGEICEYDSSCVEGLRCLPWQDTAVCTGYCLVEDSGCPEDFVCAPFQNVPKYGACLPADGIPKEPGQGPAGCVSTEVCLGGKLCLPTPTGDKKVCTELCDAGNAGSCGAGRGCWSYGSTNGGCFDLGLFPADPPDAGPEPVADAAPEAVPDAAADAAPEAVPDAGPTPDTAASEVAPDASGTPDDGPDASGPGDSSAAEATAPDSAGPKGAVSDGGGCAGGGGGGASGWALGLALLAGLATSRRRVAALRH